MRYNKSNAQAIASALKLIKAQAEREITFKVLSELFPQAAQLAQSLAPVDTGYLRDHIRVSNIGPKSATLVSMADYSAPVNYGHRTRSGSFVPAQPFFTAAEEFLRQNFVKRWLDEMDAAIAAHMAAARSTTKVIQ